MEWKSPSQVGRTITFYGVCHGPGLQDLSGHSPGCSEMALGVTHSGCLLWPIKAAPVKNRSVLWALPLSQRRARSRQGRKVGNMKYFLGGLVTCLSIIQGSKIWIW